MKRILVPLDGTKNAEAALPFLKEICDTGDEVVLLAVRTPSDPKQIGFAPGRSVRGGFSGPSGPVAGIVTPDAPVFGETKDQAHESQRLEAIDYLEGLAGPLRASGLAVQTEAVVADKAGATIVAYARTMKPTLIALLRRTRLGLSERVFGSVATEVTESQVAPVLFVPPAQQ